MSPHKRYLCVTQNQGEVIHGAGVKAPALDPDTHQPVTASAPDAGAGADADLGPTSQHPRLKSQQAFHCYFTLPRHVRVVYSSEMPVPGSCHQANERPKADRYKGGFAPFLPF